MVPGGRPASGPSAAGGPRSGENLEVGSIAGFANRLITAATAIGASALALSGCGNSRATHERPPTTRSATTRPSPASAAITPCQPAARAAIARSLIAPPGSITARASTGNNAMPQCTFSLRSASGNRITATANLDTAPQAYFRLERTIVERSQIFPTRVTPAPQSVLGLGLEASWFPGSPPQLMTTDGTRLVTISVTWPGSTQHREQHLAQSLARTYLRTPHGKAAAAIANGYPSG